MPREARVPEEVIASMNGAHGAAWAVLVAIYAHAKNGRAYPSISTLEAMTGRNRRTVTRALNDLESRGVIVRERPEPGRDHTIYRLPTRGVQTPSDDAGLGAYVAPTGGARGTGLGAYRPPKQQDLEHCLNSSVPEHVANAARALALWHGNPVDVAKLAELADGALPSELGRAVDKLTARAAASVNSPLAVLALILQDERSNRVPV